jgi:hypothetical protein
MRIDHSRKPGPFDPRYAPIRHEPVPASLSRLGEKRYDWQGFLSQFFPASRRHDSDALAAYESYLDDVDASTDRGRRRSEVEEEAPATADIDRWEGEGGASARGPRRTRTAETQKVWPRSGGRLLRSSS